MKPVLISMLLAGVVFAQPAKTLTARQMVEEIQRQAGVTPRPGTVDTFKAGNPDAAVTGIVTTFAATLDVLQRAAALGANLIVTHEPTFYSHQDETKNLQNDPVFRTKLEFIERHGLVVWRFHDGWHARKPDGIFTGMVNALGWKKYESPDAARLFVFPEMTLRTLAAQIRDKIGIHTMRVIGDPEMKITKVSLMPGAAGAESQMHALERDDVEVLVVGESREWETVEYVRDAVTEQRRKALIIMGHVVSEEAGMEECARWLKTFVSVPVEFVPAHEPFWTPR